MNAIPNNTDVPAPVATITISLLSNGAVAINGPVQDKIFCYGLLESARDAIRDFKFTPKPLIQPVHGTLPNRS